MYIIPIPLMLSMTIMLLAMLIHGLIERSKSRKALAATKVDCVAGSRLTTWLMHNPTIKPGNRPGGTLLVEQAIIAQERFLETHPYIKRGGILNLLYSQL